MCVISFYQKRLVSFSLFPELLIVHFACFFPAYVHFTCFFPGNGVWSYLGRHTGFPTGVENMGGALQNLMRGLESTHGGVWGA